MAESFQLTEDYSSLVRDLRERIGSVQVRAALAVNRELVVLYWQIGRAILDRQQRHGWGPKVIDQLSTDLRRSFPELKGFSPRNLKYMRAFAAAYPDEEFVQQLVAQIPWGHNLRILDAVDRPEERKWYVRQTVEHGWRSAGRNFYLDLLFYHLRLRCYVVIDLKVTEFQPEFAGKMNFYLSAVDEQLRHGDDGPSIGIILCKTRNRVIVEYALRDTNKPMGVSTYQLTESLPKQLKGSLPSVEEFEAELSGSGEQGEKK